MLGKSSIRSKLINSSAPFVVNSALIARSLFIDRSAELFLNQMGSIWFPWLFISVSSCSNTIALSASVSCFILARLISS